MPDTELAYMSGDDFDLPRWQTHTSASAASTPAYAYASGQQAARPPPRIAQLLEEDGQIGGSASASTTSLPYLAPSHPQLSRSTSLSSSGRDHTRQQAASFYNSSVAYQTPGYQPQTPQQHVSQQQVQQGQLQPQPTDSTDYQQDVYFSNPGAPPPKRSNTHHDVSSTSAARAARSPLRTGANQLLDPYSQQQSQYSPTASAYHHQHSRSHSQSKDTSSPYSPGIYSPSYGMDNTSPAPPPPASRSSISSPNTPLSFPVPHSHSPYYGSSGSGDPMAVDPPAKRRPSGFRRVRDARDLRPQVNPRPAGRRVDAAGTFLSPLRQLTTNIVDTYRFCNPQFKYESALNPRRVLTKPSKPSHNDGYDNEDYDYILYVNDWLGPDEGNKYLILDVLGQGTFGQVVKCQNMKTHEIVAVKVVKNKPAYFNQSMMEVTILEMLNRTCDPNDEHHILRLRDSFIHRSHLCLVFELLSSNLYELIKQNQFQGLSTQLVKVFTAQLLDALTILKDARLIHCDLKPENILLKSLQSPQIKVIDFGSACHERQTVYTYIQSRFYRSPEVLLGLPYTAAIDMWSLGCIAVELFLGLPLFPGTSEYNQITRIVEMLGLPPSHMLDMGKQTQNFFDAIPDIYGRKKYRLKSLEQYSREHNTNEQPGKQYFKATTLPDIINQAPMPQFKNGRQGSEMEREMNNRASFIDFCQGLLNLDPLQRWSPQQARMHPFITGEKWTKPFTPSSHPLQQSLPTSMNTSSSSAPGMPTPDPKRPYGGLVPTQPKGTRAYQDAASYNQQLAQHQAITAQAQAASQAANNVYRNPYITPQVPSQSSSNAYDTSGNGGYQQPQQQQQSQQHQTSQHHPAYLQPGQSQPSSARRLAHQSSHGNLIGSGASTQQQTQAHQSQSGPFSAGGLQPNPPSSSYYPSSRARANTINNMDNVPPALARLQHMNQDVISGRNALTPVLNRDDAIKEWERRQQAGAKANVAAYQPLELLQQQVELAAQQGMTSWSGPARYAAHGHPTSSLAHQYHPPQPPQGALIAPEDERRDAILSNVRAGVRADAGGTQSFGAAVQGVISSPPQAYTGTAGGGASSRYAYQPPSGASQATSQAQQGQPASSYERGDINMYVPMQPDQYGAYGRSTGGGGGSGGGSGGGNGGQSFYSPAVAAAQGSSSQRNPFASADTAQQQVTPGSNGVAKDRRGSGMDFWPG